MFDNKAYQRRYYQENKEKMKQQHKDWYREHRDARLRQISEYEKANAEHLREYRTKYMRDKRRKDQGYRAKNVARVVAWRKIPLGDTCELCGGAATQRHHPDYAEPLLVTSVCVSCHRKLHQTTSKE